MESKPVIIIEFLEEKLTPWLLLEIRHASIIYGREYLWITNTPVKYQRLLSRYGYVYSDSVIDLVSNNRINAGDVIVLDPIASKPLEYLDLVRFKFVVIGGILGDHPPQRRTHKYITSKLPSNINARNIGDNQYSIDGSVFYVNYMLINKSMSNYKYVDGVLLKRDDREIYLPFRYPVVNGKPLLTPGLEEYLFTGEIPDYIRKELES